MAKKADNGGLALAWRAAACAGLLVLCLQGEAALAFCGGDYGSSGEGGSTEPVDSDCDGVPDDRDMCPEIPGVASNGGCPEGWELVFVTGIPEAAICPDGSKVGHQTQCPKFEYWNTAVVRELTYNSRTHEVSSLDNAAQCGETVDAKCACGDGKVKVYDEGKHKFHCKPAPPDGGCPEWGNTFNFDPSVWKCEPNPASEYMGEIKDCLPPGNIPAVYWANVPYFRWNNNLKNADGKPVLGTTYISESSIVGIEFNYRHMVDSAAATANVSVTDAANLMIHDELIHVRDVVRYGGPNAWENPGMEAEIQSATSWGDPPYTKAEYEEFTFSRARGEIDLGGKKPDAGCLEKQQ